MGCFYPLKATQLPGGQILIHRRTPGIHRASTPPHLGKDINLPCGRCTGCKILRAQQWATRCLHESQQHQDNCFLTLTINEENMALYAPEGSLLKSTHQNFMKRLRYDVGVKVRYYMCGEYGEQLKRPHYHYLLFGWKPNDLYYSHTSKSSEKLYRSPTLEDLWAHGKCWVGEVTYESCAYVASYVMKKLNGSKAEEHYLRVDEAGNNFWLEPEFNEMSRKPGIARTWWDEFNPDVYTDDMVVRIGGSKMKPPRYYDKLLELMDPSAMVLIKHRREMRGKESADDNTPARLADKEKVLEARLNLKKRDLEQQNENDYRRNF